MFTVPVNNRLRQDTVLLYLQSHFISHVSRALDVVTIQNNEPKLYLDNIVRTEEISNISVTIIFSCFLK